MAVVNAHPDEAGSAHERIVPGTAQWDAGYPDHVQRYRFAIGFLRSGAAVLDAGCGVGYGAAELAAAGAGRVVAVDIADDALALAHTHFAHPRIEWCRDDCHELEHAARSGPYDLVTNFENLEHLAHPERFVARAAALLQPDGLLVTSTPNRLLLNRLRGAAPDAPSTNPYHVNEFSADEFRSLLEEYFDDVRLWYQSPAGFAGLRLRARSFAGRLGLVPLLRYVRYYQRRIQAKGVPSVAGASASADPAPAVMKEWHIRERAPAFDTAWTIIAVCRGPRTAQSSAHVD